MKNFTLIAVFMMIAIFAMAQNMGQQYVTVITVADTLYSPPYEVSFVSENQFPGQAISLGSNIAIGRDTLKASTQKDWADIVLVSFGDDEIVISQKPTIQSFYMAAFVNRSYYFVCRGDECRWLTPLWTDFEFDRKIMRFEQDMEWPAFQTTYYDSGTVILEEYGQCSDGSPYQKSFIYREPMYEVHTAALRLRMEE